MNRLTQEKILLNASILYGCFPATPMTENHRIILKCSNAVKRIAEYRGHTAGKNALPPELLSVRYQEFWDLLKDLEGKLERGKPASREAQKALDDLDSFLNWIFLGSK